MKKFMYTCISGLVLMASCAIVSACETPTKPTVSGFDVAATASAEVGEHYTIAIPEVSVSDGEFDLSVTAKNGTGRLHIIGNEIMIMDFTPHIITYTLSYGTETMVKETTITPTDTTAPAIKFMGVDTTVYTSTEYDLSDVIADDNSFEKLDVQLKVVHVETEQVLTLTENKFTTPSQIGSTIRLEATATDSHSNTITAMKDLYVIGRDDFGTIDTFDSQEIIQYSNTFAGTQERTTFSSVSSQNEGEIEGIRGRALKVECKNYTYGSVEAAFVNLNKTKMVNAANFDYLTFRIYVDAGTALKETKSTVSVKLKNTGAPGVAGVSGWMEYTVQKEHFPSNNEFVFEIGHWCDKDTKANFTVYFDEITGGYQKSVYVGESVNVLEALGVAETELTGLTLQNTVGATLQDNVFTAQSAGRYTLSITVNKAPYNITTFDYVIKVVVPPQYQDFLSLGEDNTTLYKITNEKGSEQPSVTKTIENAANIQAEGNALRLEMGTGVQNGKYVLHIPGITGKRLNQFDYFTVVGYVESERNEFRFSALANENEIPEYDRLLNVRGAFTYRVDKKYFGDYLQLTFSDWTGAQANQAQALWILSIVGGYNDVETEKSINILEKTGFAVDEITNAYFENATGAQTPIDDLESFIPMEIGKISVNVSIVGYTDSIIEIKVAKYPTYDVLDDFTSDASDYVSQADRFQFTIVDGAEVTVGTQTGMELGLTGKVLKIDDVGTTETGRTWVEFATLPLANIRFDYVMISGYVDHKFDGTRNLSLQVGSDSNADNRTALVTFEKGSGTYFEIKISKNWFTQMGSTNFRLLINNWATVAEELKAIYITGMIGGYDDVAVGEAVNLVETTGLTAEEITDAYFENATGTQTPINDVTAFTATETGTITFVVSKDGYKDTTMTVNVLSGEAQ